MRLLGILKKLVGRAEYVEVIADKTANADIPNGFAGGSLANDNILIVSNANMPEEVVKDVFSKELACYSVIFPQGALSVEGIMDAGKDLIGPFTHIINVFFDKEDGSLISKDGEYNRNDSMYQFYQWHQEEVDYLVKLNQYATICTVFIGESSIEGNVKKHNVEMCIRGLAEVLCNHGIICNALIASGADKLKELLETSVFLSSRYGQIMTGEVLKMD